MIRLMPNNILCVLVRTAIDMTAAHLIFDLEARCLDLWCGDGNSFEGNT